jgi:hypothetical protein
MHKPTTCGLGSAPSLPTLEDGDAEKCYFYSSPGLASLHCQGQHFGDISLGFAIHAVTNTLHFENFSG